jgi:hypothetical protein
MKKRTTLLAVLLTSALAGGCTISGRAHTSPGYAHSSAELVYVSPGVYAVANYHEPVFYSDNSYWLYRDNTWYRSGYYTGGWTRVRSAPRAVISIERPHAYVRYRGEGRQRIRARDHRRDRGRDRHHRGYY